LVEPETIDRAVEALAAEHDAQVATTWEHITDPGDVLSPAVVKVVVDGQRNGLYFSRAPIPWPREAVRRYGSLAAALDHEPALLSTFRKHTGLYAYRRTFLLKFNSWPQSALERIEALEQLRSLERGVKIKVVEAAASSIGVDTIEDFERVRAIIESGLRLAV
jgi:3-deoxy-manno-octulosonate cytidylyltransferase (CMP-KDO synthetase)